VIRSARLSSPNQLQTSLTPDFYLSKSSCWGNMDSVYFLRARLALCVDPTGLASSLVPAFLDETLHLLRLLRGAPVCGAESKCAVRRMIIILSVLSGTDNAIVLAQAKHLLLRNSSGRKAAALSHRTRVNQSRLCIKSLTLPRTNAAPLRFRSMVSI
jgi:hypothetical protein